MKKYSRTELVLIVHKKISEQYDSPDKILNDFIEDIHTRVWIISKKKLSDIETSEQSEKVAKDIFASLKKITFTVIINSFSREILQKSYGEGLVLEDHEDYFNELVKRIIQKLLRENLDVYKRLRHKE